MLASNSTCGCARLARVSNTRSSRRRPSPVNRVACRVLASASIRPSGPGQEDTQSSSLPNAAAPRLVSSPLHHLQSLITGTPRSTRLQAAADVAFGGDGGTGGSDGVGGEGRRGDSNDGDDDRVLSYEEVEAAALEKKIDLPADLLKTAKQFGLRSSALNAYFGLQGLALAGLLVRSMPWVRNRMIADPRFLFKVVAEVAIDSGCATVAEVRKRGDDFWGEFEFYLSDLLVGLALDVVLVALMAPAAPVAGVSRAATSTGLQKLLATIPSAVFQASVPGAAPFTLAQRLGCLAVKFGEYSLAGIACGFVGQGAANGMMLLRRHMKGGSSEHDVAVPPLLKTALVWGLFMGVSANVRYQTVFGLERLVDMTIAKKVPQIAYATTIGIRFVNNVIGGEMFIDMARWAGVQ